MRVLWRSWPWHWLQPPPHTKLHNGNVVRGGIVSWGGHLGYVSGSFLLIFGADLTPED